MTRNDFKDMLFDLINDNDEFIKDIETDDTNNIFTITNKDGSSFIIEVHDNPISPRIKDKMVRP